MAGSKGERNQHACMRRASEQDRAGTRQAIAFE